MSRAPTSVSSRGWIHSPEKEYWAQTGGPESLVQPQGPPLLPTHHPPPQPWGRLWHLHQQAQDIVDGDPTKGAFILPCQELRAPEVHRGLAQGLADRSKDVLRLREILEAAQGGWGGVGGSRPCSLSRVEPQSQGRVDPTPAPHLSSRMPAVAPRNMDVS